MPLITISQLLDESFRKHKIIPDVVDEFDSQGLLTIEYDKDVQVTVGNTLKPDVLQKQPTVQFTLNSPNQELELQVSKEDKFTLVLTDPDAPSRTDKKWSEYLHWLVTDLSLNTADDGSENSLSTILDLSKGTEVIPYLGPAPPEKTGKHRYVFLFFKQDPAAKLKPKDRPNWGTGVPGSGVRDYFKQHGGDSELLAVNFFYAQNDVQE